ncbi:MAG: hypothetical protein ACQEXJ_22245 [Myxococcota bacterium]
MGTKLRMHAVAALAIGGLLWTGCSALDTAVDSAVDRAAHRTGEAVGDRVGAAAAAHVGASLDRVTPGLVQAYTKALFMVVLYHGGYELGLDAYEPGDWTRWTVEQGAEEQTYEKAFLARTDEGEEWWRIEVHETDDGGESQEFIAEALFAAPESEDHQVRDLLRLRVKYPDEEQPEEVPVTEDEAGWHLQTTRLTEESIEGATVGTETIAVPAGTFTADKVRYGHPGGAMIWWLNDDVVGGVVRYQRVAKQQGEEDEEQPDDRTYTLSLADQGEDATTSRLGAFE